MVKHTNSLMYPKNEDEAQVFIGGIETFYCMGGIRREVKITRFKNEIYCSNSQPFQFGDN